MLSYHFTGEREDVNTYLGTILLQRLDAETRRTEKTTGFPCAPPTRPCEAASMLRFARTHARAPRQVPGMNYENHYRMCIGCVWDLYGVRVNSRQQSVRSDPSVVGDRLSGGGLSWASMQRTEHTG